MQRKEKNITIRNFEEKDVPHKVKIINNEQNNKYLHYDLPLEEEKTTSWYYKIKDNNNRLDLTVLYNDVVVGFIGLLSIDNINRKAEYYICIDNSFSGKGIGYNSSMLLIQYAFDELKLNKIYLYTEKDNLKAQHLFEKLGFLNEGLLKNDIIYKNKFVSRYAFGLCKDDFNA